MDIQSKGGGCLVNIHPFKNSKHCNRHNHISDSRPSSPAAHGVVIDQFSRICG